MTYSAEVLADSPLVYYRMDETSGATMADSSGNGRDGTYYNAPTLAEAGPITSDATNLAVALNGTDEYAGIAHGTWADVPSVTLEAWVKTTGTDGIVLGSLNTSGHPYVLRVHSTFGIYFEVRTAAGYTLYRYSGSPASVRDGNWHHICGTYQSGTPGVIKVYLDGVEIAGTTNGPTNGDIVTTGYTDTRTIGRRGNGVYYSGSVARPAIYGTAVSAGRVAAHYAAATVAADPSGMLSAVLPVPAATLAGVYDGPLVGALAAALPAPTVTVAGAYTPPSGPGGHLVASLPVPSLSLTGRFHARNGYGLVLDSETTVDAEAPLPATPSDSGTPALVLHVVTPTVPTPVLTKGRPS